MHGRTLRGVRPPGRGRLAGFDHRTTARPEPGVSGGPGRSGPLGRYFFRRLTLPIVSDFFRFARAIHGGLPALSDRHGLIPYWDASSEVATEPIEKGGSLNRAFWISH